MRFSILPNIADIPRAVDSPWDDLIASLRAHVITPDKRSVPLFSPASFIPGAPRQMEYVESVSFGVIDLDHLNHDEAVELMAFLANLPFRYAFYTTHSHGAVSDGTGVSAKKGHPAGTVEYAYRIIFPFLSPVPGKEWPKFWQRMAELFVTPSGRTRPDKQCSDASRAYYVPAAHPQRAELVQFYERPDLPQFDPSTLRLEVQVMNMGANGRMYPAPGSPFTATGEPGRKVTRGGLETLASRLKRKRNPTGEALAKVLDGLPWAEPGERDNTLYRLAGDIAQEFPQADMREVAEFFALSVDRIQDPDFTPELVLAKLLRRQAEVQAENTRKELEREAERETRIRAAFREVSQERGSPYTDDEVEMFATLSGVSRVEFQHRWIIQTGGAFYFFFNGTYVGPIKESDAQIAARKYLSPAPVDLDQKDAFGRVSPRTITSLAAEYGTHCLYVVADLNNDLCIFDPKTSTLIEAPCPLRPLTARFWPEIDEWLRLMAGMKYDLLLDWISWVTDLDRPCTALFLQGTPNAGKSLFASGLARLWTNGPPSTLEQAIGGKTDWNDSIMRCPLIFADEKVPKDIRGNARTEDIREFIQQRERPLKRRFCSDAVMRGATRLVIAANNRNLLQTHEAALTVHDIQAIADRILLIPVGEETPRYLNGLGQQTIDQWTRGDRIAEHALWIVENRIRNPHPPRFLVQGANAKLHTDIAFGTSIGSAVAHWLVSFMEDPSRLWAGKHPSHTAFGITYSAAPDPRFTPGLVVSAQCLADNWETYRTNVKPEKATLRAVGMSLQAISEGRATWHFPGGVKRQCARVPLSNLIVWGEENGYHSDTLINAAAKLQGLLAARGDK